MGSALASYKEFQRQGFNIKLVLDNDQRKIGSDHKGMEVRDVKDLEKELKTNKIDMVILAVPANAAQSLADDVQKTGVKAILNFAPVNLRAKDETHVRSENMAMELEYLSFCLTNKTTPSSG